MTDPFRLHPQLAADTDLVTEGPLSRILMMNDARYPWLILVPRRNDLVDYDDLTDDERDMLGRECAETSKIVKRLFESNKTNVAMLGNMVPQLHCHVVARFPGDPAWPGPVWGIGQSLPFREDDAKDRIEALRAELITAFRTV